MKGLPANYEYSKWVLNSRQDNIKPVYKYELTQNACVLDHKYQVPKPQFNKTFTTEYTYDQFLTKTKEHIKSFNYTKQDKLKINNSIILDLHSNSSTLEALDKAFDIRDGYII